VLPEPVTASVGNFFSNLNDVVVLVNDLLQFKLHQAAMDSSRIVFNTTFGLAGLFDVATRMMLLPAWIYRNITKTLAKP